MFTVITVAKATQIRNLMKMHLNVVFALPKAGVDQHTQYQSTRTRGCLPDFGPHRPLLFSNKIIWDKVGD